MARAPFQSDFVVVSDRPTEPAGEDDDGKPEQASASATRWVMTATWVILLLLVLLVIIGPHIPAGE